MKVSGVAIGQWNQICKKKEGIRRTIYKIFRAIVMGKVSHVYKTGDYIVRYYDMNVLVSRTGLVLTVWRDTETEIHNIPQSIREKYDLETTHKMNIMKAIEKHRGIVKKGLRHNAEKIGD
jgi:hypothetical protein